jgi:hypothetical protein
MFSIAREMVPEDSLLKRHRGVVRPERWGSYGDCFSVSVDRAASLADFVFAFYTSPLFRVERLILRVLAGAPADDADARALAQGSAKFGSAVAATPRHEARALAPNGAVFPLLLKVHVLYSHLLLLAAGSGVMKATREMDVGER